ncbi:MAG: CotH kinase family protein, partial [Gammaproteobacteria bacterium]|nr:CotH kinase family protein [Gammaproteobacteria bacterium]
GSNLLCIQTHNATLFSSDMSSRVFLSLGINNTSNDYNPTPIWFTAPILLFDSNLPIVVVNTNNVSIPDEPKIDAFMGIIYNGPGARNYMSDPFNEYQGDIGIERRGSSSGGFPKKAYGLETRGPNGENNNVNLFGWPADNDWILYAPYSDKSLIRNVLTYHLGNETGHYAPRTQLCELVINGNYQGVYVLMERIKQSPGRVNVDKLTIADTLNNELSGGYIVKIDKFTAGGILAWISPIPPYVGAPVPISYQFHDPEFDTLLPVQKQYIENYITDFELALDGANFTDPVLGYQPYIDLMSFIDYMIINEISRNVDGYRLSSYFHKHRVSEGGKLVAGPLWDFNLAWGNANYCNGSVIAGWEIDFELVCGGGGFQNPFWWKKFVQDPFFTNVLNCRWQELRQDVLHKDSLFAYIDTLAAHLNESQARNFQKWQILGTYVWPNNFIGNTHAEEITYLKTWINARIDWIDANMFGSCTNLGTDETAFAQIKVYPNPSSSDVNFDFGQILNQARLVLYDQLGKEMMSVNIDNESKLNLDLSDLSKGLYYYNIYDKGEIKKSGKLIRQ